MPLVFGKISGFRGNRGELTVRVASGNAGRWTELTKVLVEHPERGSEQKATEREVEGARAYRDRLVLKLRGVDDPGAAEALRGWNVSAPDDQVPFLPAGVYYQQRLLGLRVIDENGMEVGEVEDVVNTGGAALLAVRRGSGKSLLVPMAESILLEIRPEDGWIRVRLPNGLEDLEES